MMIWIMLLLTVDMMLMGGIFYVLMGRRKALKKAQLPAEQPSGAPGQPILREIKEELSAAKKVAIQLEKKRLAFEEFERSLQDKNKKLETILKKAEQTVKSGLSPDNGEVYSRAMTMLRTGTPAEEIIRSLGLLNGEVELINSLNNYRV